ncbi:MAG: hypothetical protein KDC80_07050 [Saprospiraceae bacterium]|nr:hypothetical protein [Saprospiraceae bacterium]
MKRSEIRGLRGKSVSSPAGLKGIRWRNTPNVSGLRNWRRKQRGGSIGHSVGVSRDGRSPMSDTWCGVFGIRGLAHLALLIHLAPFV